MLASLCPLRWPRWVLFAPQAQVDPVGGRAARLTPVENFTDIRYDEDYAAFYQLHAGERKLPPPVDGTTLYTDLHNYLQAQQAQQAQQQAKDVSTLLQATGSRLSALSGTSALSAPTGLLTGGVGVGGGKPVPFARQCWSRGLLLASRERGGSAG